MDVYLTEDIFSHLLSSLSIEIKKYYANDLPVLIAVGISGIEIVTRLAEILNNEKIEVYACDVVRKGTNVTEITNFPETEVKGKKVLITYVRVDTGNTLRAVAKQATACGAIDVKTMSIAARNNASCFPHFFSSIINAEDNLYLLLEGYPPDIEWPYPQVLTPPGDFVRELDENDVSSQWFKCGDERIDKTGIGEYLYFLRCNKSGKVFVVEKESKIIAALHFNIKSTTARIDTLAVDVNYSEQGIGTDLMLFFIEYCRFKGIRTITLDAFKTKETFYKEKLGFRKRHDFSISGYADFVVMYRRIN